MNRKIVAPTFQSARLACWKTSAPKSNGFMASIHVGFSEVFLPHEPRGAGCPLRSDPRILQMHTDEVESKFWGARASGVWFSASRRKLRVANFFLPETQNGVWNESSGATPELARETRALPSQHSEPSIRVQLLEVPLLHETPTPSDVPRCRRNKFRVPIELFQLTAGTNARADPWGQACSRDGSGRPYCGMWPRL